MPGAIHSHQPESRRLVALTILIYLFERANFRLRPITTHPRLHRLRRELHFPLSLEVRHPALRFHGVADKIQVALVDHDVDLVR